jgi:hypothetical protein
MMKLTGELYRPILEVLQTLSMKARHTAACFLIFNSKSKWQKTTTITSGAPSIFAADKKIVKVRDVVNP